MDDKNKNLKFNREVIRLYVEEYDKQKKENNLDADIKSIYDNICLKETKIYNSNNILYGVFKSKGINTIGQILDDELMCNAKKHTRAADDIDRLTIFIDIIKNQYLGIPLPQVAKFDEKIDKNIINFSFQYGYRARYNDVSLEEFDFLNKCYVLGFNEYKDFPDETKKKFVIISKCISSTLEFAYHKGYLNENSTYIDFFEFLLSKNNTWYNINDLSKAILNIYINEYKKQKNFDLNDTEKLEKMKEELGKLIESRDSLDKQISEITKSIAEYKEKISSKGSM